MIETKCKIFGVRDILSCNNNSGRNNFFIIFFLVIMTWYIMIFFNQRYIMFDE